jgi:transposase
MRGRALLLQALYAIRSERQLMEQLDCNLLYRWFVGLYMEDPVWDPTVFTKNREWLLKGDSARAFFRAVVAQAEAAGLLSADHFTVDFRGPKRSNRTHASTTDPDARLTKRNV